MNIGGAPVITLRREGEGLAEAQILPGRGMMLGQAKFRGSDGQMMPILESPPSEAWANVLDGGPDDFAGNASFSFGGAVLFPYANRITGRAVEGAREIEASLDGAAARLPRNWGGKAPGAAQYAMHGLTLATPFDYEQPDEATLIGRLRDWDFGGYWLGRADLEITWRLSAGGLQLTVEAHNRSDFDVPIGIGWHPWFRFPSGERRQARLVVPADARLAVDNYDQVLPTGEVLPVANTPQDFRVGRALGDLYLDDCFVHLTRDRQGRVVVEAHDPAASYGVRLTSSSPAIRAVQVYAPLDRALVALEPQFNWADPFSEKWARGQDTGMQRVRPGARTLYTVITEVFSPGA